MNDMIWTCDVCGEPVTNDDGYICVQTGEIEAAQRASRQAVARASEWEGAAMPFPEVGASVLARWQCLHGACDPGPEDGGPYWFPIMSVQSWPSLMQTTLHIASKPWYPVTDWPTFIRSRFIPGSA